MSDTVHEDSPLVQNSVLMAAVKWGRGSGAQYFSGTAGPQMARCLERLVSILQPDDVELPARNYSLKAARLVTEYIRFCEDRVGYKPLKEFTRRSVPRKSKPAANASKPSQQVTVPLSSMTVDIASAMRDLPLGNGRRFLFELPDPDGLSPDDYERIEAHLKSFVIYKEDFVAVEDTDDMNNADAA
jgi:hypothetical protein